MGTTTALNTLTGAVAMINAKQRFDLASNVSYSEGMVESGIDMGRGVIQSLGGLSYAINRPVDIAARLTNVNSSAQATTALGKVCYWTGMVGGVLFGGFYAIMILYFGISLYRTYALCSQMYKDKHVDKLSEGDNAIKLAEFFNTKTTGSTAQEIWDKGIDKSKLHKETFLAAERLARSSCQNLGEKIPASLREKILEIMGQLDDNTPLRNKLIEDLGLDQGTDITTSELIGLQFKVEQEHQQMQMRLEDQIGSIASTLWSQAKDHHILKRLQDSDSTIKEAAIEELAEILKQAQQGINTNLTVSWSLFIAGIIGFTATIVSLTLSGGTAQLAAGWLFFMAALCMMLADTTVLRNALQSEGPTGAKDKIMSQISLSAGIASLVFTVVLVSLAKQDPVTVVLALIIGILWVFQAEYVYQNISEKESKHRMNHLSLSECIQKAQEGKLHEIKALIPEKYLSQISTDEELVFPEFSREQKEQLNGFLKELVMALGEEKLLSVLGQMDRKDAYSEDVRGIYERARSRDLDAATLSIFEKSLKLKKKIGAAMLIENQKELQRDRISLDMLQQLQANEAKERIVQSEKIKDVFLR